MKFIAKERWENFLKTLIEEFQEKSPSELPKISNKGIMFEILVERLLAFMFDKCNIIFQGTKPSHDGSKDFWAIDEANDVWWAECKNYTPNISLTQLAPTLIMAEINSVQHLLFFSYSKLNDNLKRRIAQYASEHNKEVFLYDDETLESLIFSHQKEAFKKILGLADDGKVEFDHNMEVHFFNEQNARSLKRRNYNGYYEIEELQVGNVYDLNVVFINKHPSEKCEVTLFIKNPASEDNLYFEFLFAGNGKISEDKKQILVLKPNQLLLGKFTVKVIKFKEKLRLPQLSYVAKYSTYETKQAAPMKEYDCRWTRKAVLIGSNYESITKRFEECCIKKDKLSGLLVYGSGGTGKTRILEECSDLLIKNNYNLLNFTGFDSSGSWKDVIREITFSVFEISRDITFEVMCNMSDIITPHVQDSVKKEIIEFLSVLKQEDYHCENLERYYRIIYGKLLQRNYAIIIDNMQSYDPQLLTFFSKMINFFINYQRESHLILLFSINTSLVFDNRFLDFVGNFESISGDAISTNFIAQQTTGFNSENNAITFLKTILRLEDYPLNFYTLQQILARTSHKPKYIELMADYLIQQGLIRIDHDRGIIEKPVQLQKEMEHIPGKYEQLFSKTYRLMLKQFPEKINDFKDFISMVYLFSELDDRMIDALKLGRDTAEILTKHNIIKDKGDAYSHCYVFEHDLIEICLNKEIYSDLPEHALKYIENYEVLFQTVLNDKFAQYSLYMLYTKRMSLQEILKINAEKDAIAISNKFAYKFHEYLIQNIIIHKKFMSQASFIHETLNCCNYVRDHISEIQAKNLFSQAFPHVFSITLNTKEIIQQHFSFVIHYCENRNRLRDTAESIKQYTEYLEKLKKLETDFPDLKIQIQYAEAYVYNRVFVSGKIEGEIGRYFLQLKRSIQLSHKYKFFDILFENYFDAANIYFQDNRHVEKGVRLLKKGFEYFEKMPRTTKEKFIVNYYSKKILYYLLKRDVRLAEKTIQTALENLKNNHHINYHIFFKGRYLKFRIIALLLAKEIDTKLKEAFEDYEEFLQITQREEDFEWYFLQAKYAFYLKIRLIFESMFEQCYSMVINNHSTIKGECRELYMMNDLAVMLRQVNLQKTRWTFLNQGAETMHTVNHILTITPADFEKYVSTYQSSAPIVDSEKKDGYFP